jgi:hypothetical protein
MTDNDEIIEVVKLKIHDPVVQKEIDLKILHLKNKFNF